MGLPIIDISFKQLAKTAVIRSQRGIVALILKDTTKASLTVFDEGDIPTTDVVFTVDENGEFGSAEGLKPIYPYITDRNGELLSNVYLKRFADGRFIHRNSPLWAFAMSVSAVLNPKI